MSLLAIRISRQPKNSASKNTPSSTLRVGDARFDHADDFRDADCLHLADLRHALLEEHHPAASKTSPMRRIRSNLAISQILVANQFDAELS